MERNRAQQETQFTPEQNEALALCYTLLFRAGLQRRERRIAELEQAEPVQQLPFPVVEFDATKL